LSGEFNFGFYLTEFKHGLSREADCSSSGQQYRHLNKPDGHLAYSEERFTGSSSEPTESTSQANKLFHKINFIIIFLFIPSFPM
jgi:hypothetical protein